MVRFMLRIARWNFCLELSDWGAENSVVEAVLVGGFRGFTNAKNNAESIRINFENNKSAESFRVFAKITKSTDTKKHYNLYVAEKKK